MFLFDSVNIFPGTMQELKRQISSIMNSQFKLPNSMKIRELQETLGNFKESSELQGITGNSRKFQGPPDNSRESLETEFQESPGNFIKLY